MVPSSSSAKVGPDRSTFSLDITAAFILSTILSGGIVWGARRQDPDSRFFPRILIRTQNQPRPTSSVG